MRRLARILTILLVLLGLSWYGKTNNPAITLQECLQQPDRYEGTRIQVATEVTVIQTWPDSLRVHQMGAFCTVVGPPGDARPGDFVSMSAIFHAPGWLELVELHPARGRRAKIIWSMLPLLVLAGAWLAAYRCNWRRFYWEPRK
jgi:hypothetical protein